MRSCWAVHAAVVIGDGDVHDASALVREDDEHEQQPVSRGRHDEEVGRHDLADVVRQEGAPRLRWWLRRRSMYFATVA